MSESRHSTVSEAKEIGRLLAEHERVLNDLRLICGYFPAYFPFELINHIEREYPLPTRSIILGTLYALIQVGIPSRQIEAHWRAGQPSLSVTQLFAAIELGVVARRESLSRPLEVSYEEEVVGGYTISEAWAALEERKGRNKRT